MAKKRIRFAIQTESQISELFSLIEKSDGTINIFYNRPATTTVNNHIGSAAVMEHRTTLHTSERSKDGGKTFMHTQRLSDGRYYRNSAYVLPNDEGIAWVLTSVLSQNPNLDIYRCDSKAGDEVIILDKINTKRMTLIYHIVVTDNFHYYDIGNINSLHKLFCKFTISVYWLYLASPSIPIGRNFSLGSSLLTINGFYTQMDPMKFNGVISPNLLEVANTFNKMHNEFKRDHIINTKRYLLKNGAKISPELKEQIEQCSNVILVRPPLELLV